MTTFQGTPFGPHVRTSDEWPRKNVAVAGLYAQLIHDFDTWRPLYGNAIVTIYKAGTQFKARVFTDPEMTEEADNPQTLLERTFEGVSYGKFAEALYTPDAYEIDIGSTDQTGITRPAITDLNGENGSQIVVKPDGARLYRPLEDHLSQVVYAEDYGVFGTSAAANTAAIQAAIGAVGARGGGFVMLPPGTYPFLQLTLPTGVILAGYHQLATVLQSQIAGAVITLNGANAGVMNLTLDGISAVASSIGIYAKGQDDILVVSTVIRSFETNILMRGGARPIFRDVSCLNGTWGARLLGHLDTVDGGPLTGLRWSGGRIESNVTAGVHLQFVDEEVRSAVLLGLEFQDNLTDGLILEGVRFSRVQDCTFDDNARSLRVIDAAPLGTTNFTQSLVVERGRFAAGGVNIDGLAIDVSFDRCDFSGTTIDLETTIRNPVRMLDCVEDGAVQLAGDATRLIRWRSTDRGEVRGSTTNNTATKAIANSMYPGEVAMLLATVIGVQRNGEDHAAYIIARAARRDTADLDFDGGTIAFTVGDLVVGGTSGASGYVTAVTGSTAAGTLSLKSIAGEFQNNEQLTVDGTPHALANGVLSDPSVSLLGSDTVLFAFESDTTWAAAFDASGDEAQLKVTGANSKLVEWTARLDRLTG